ncbi:hypothetical protein LENED_011120 [Lentinula edodes]|uniref:Uncharacterized protein n=1 Tax=Lentinula edodes TaxID=5353 RepID=A0A1Q3EP73_LENED|nr:hypothetical protein LENED_011120 [Lentinula edodes]
MNQANTILLSLNADAAIASVSSSVGISPDMVLQQAQTYVQATLSTKVGGFVFFVRIEIDDESIMAKQLGHSSYEWIRWTKGTLREALKTNPNIELVQVVAIRAQEFNELPPREFLPELPGGNFFHERAFKAPSNGAKPTEFSDSQADPKTRIHIDRPREPGNTSVSIALLVPSFGNFQTNIKNIAPSDRAMLFATKMANELCVIFRYMIGDSKTDGGVFHKYTAIDKDGAARLLLKVKLEQIGTSDPCFQVSLYYLENTRRVRQDVVNSNEETAAWARARLPSILISHPGPNIQILGGVMTDRPQFRVLTPSLPMYYHVSNQDLFLGFARTLTALNVLFVDLGKLYDNPPPLNPFLPV